MKWFAMLRALVRYISGYADHTAVLIMRRENDVLWHDCAAT